ncbi:hypothetical protein BV22DRAFT_1067123 [Leucogyrophana mollusca]|uniref:Uncharacterized protein n=1 Tax=Leucogyrophana mollusca TaxID=85980 RepID=A0ACB8BEX9_9AGAM|nr:hypothetical protein BV22DRAFT_1067123 [Leucogyrophana mollusca]
MTHFTTTTATYTLGKYSRSYPSSTLSTHAQAGADSEWQHFVNPVIKLLVDAKKSSNGDLVSVRLRIVWLMSCGADEMDVDQREVIFEDLDLLSFSSLPSLKSYPTQPDHGLPLKAVYRDAIVGIRYLHPKLCGPDKQPLYRRFQITFTSAASAAQFIDAIRNVCPCKANPPPQIVNRQPTMAPPNQLPRSDSVTLPRCATESIAKPRLPMARALTSSIIPPDLSPRTPVTSDLGVSSFTGSTPSRPIFLDNSSPQPSSSQQITALSSSDSNKSSLPDSSQLSSSNRSDSSMMPPPPLPSSIPISTEAPEITAPSLRAPGIPSSPFIASLNETSSLNQLSREDLESLVSQVVREEGFQQLLDSLDTMWKVKGFLAR